MQLEEGRPDHQRRRAPDCERLSMSVENLKNSLPEYAKDLKLNLSSIARTTVLNEQQLWGTLLATAAATKSASPLKEIASEAADNLPAEAEDRKSAVKGRSVAERVDLGGRRGMNK